MHSSSTKENQAAQPSTSGQMSSRSKRELIECPICTATVKHPKLLPCGHSLCGPQSEEKCLLKWEKCQEISGEIKCPICQKVYQMEASDALTPYGFKEVLEGIESMRVCERHNVEIKFYCNEDNEEICDLCWKEGHLKHDIDLIEVAKCNKLSPKWERRQLEDLRKLCLEAAEAFGEGADFLLGKQERYNRIADMCLSLQQKQRQIDEKFQRKDFDHDDEDIAEFEQYIEYIEKEAEKLAADLAKLDELSAELKRVTAKTAQELKTRQGEPDLDDLNVEIKDAPASQLPSTSTAERVGNKPEKEPTPSVPTDAPSPSTSIASTVTDREAANVPSEQSNIRVPTDTIIAFGLWWKNEIWKSGTNKWTKWKKVRNCGERYACVKAHSNIYFIGGKRGGEDSTETVIHDISKEKWSKGPQLKVGRHRAAACFDIYNCQIIVVGGCNNGGRSDSVETLKVHEQRPIGEWEQIESMSSERDVCAAAFLDDKLFVAGGVTGDGVTASVEMIDLGSATPEWKKCAPMQEKRRDHAMIAFKSELFVFGGDNGSNKMASCEKYSPINNTWQKISNMRVARSVCGVCLMGDRIYVVGGYCGKVEDQKTVEVYNPDRDEWTEGPMLTNILGATKCVSW